MNSSISPFTWCFIGIFVIFLLGSLLHFAYKLFGKNDLICFFVPVNESVWEHTKLGILPSVFWWVLFFFFSADVSINAWLTGLIVSIICNVLSTIFLFYFYTNAFDINLLWIDIGIFFVSCLVGQLIGYHVYANTNGFSLFTSILLLICIFSIYTLFTLFTPKFSLFQDSSK